MRNRAVKTFRTIRDYSVCTNPLREGPNEKHIPVADQRLKAGPPFTPTSRMNIGLIDIDACYQATPIDEVIDHTLLSTLPQQSLQQCMQFSG